MDKPNILIDTLPDTVEVDGRVFSIRTSFRIGIMFEQLILDQTIDGTEMTKYALELYYEEIPDDVDEAVNAILWFYSCGEYVKPESVKAEEGNDKGQANSNPRYYDYDVDAGRIYAAFLDQYGIDLNDSDLHWWKFHALFSALKADNEFCRIVEYRSVDLSKIKNKKERQRLATLKHKYALPCTLTMEQKVAMAGNAFAGGSK